MTPGIRVGLAVVAGLLVAGVLPAKAADDGGCTRLQRRYGNREQIPSDRPVHRPGQSEVLQCVNGRWLFKLCEATSLWQCSQVSYDEDALRR